MDDMIDWCEEWLNEPVKAPCGSETCEDCGIFPCFRLENEI